MLYHNELNLLSQLAALDLPIAASALHDYTVGEMVAALLKRVKSLAGDCAMSSTEWSNSLHLIQTNSHLTSLKVLAYTNHPKSALVAYCFFEQAENTGIIAFRGTTGTGWIDNIKGGFLCDTPQQIKALEFFHEVNDTFNINDYIITGHSKGGNNGQYITIVDGNKISHCITFNSQGFSAEFIRKYTLQIKENQNKIIAYECAWDVVNILFINIAAKRIVVGTESRLPHRNHPPNRLLNQNGDIRDFDNRHPLYSGIQNFTASLSQLVSKVKQRIEKNKFKDK